MRRSLITVLLVIFSFTGCNSSADMNIKNEETSIETEQDIPVFTPPDEIELADTLKIMETYNIDGVEAAVGYDENYNLFVTFDTADDNRRIPVKKSSEPETEWLDYESDSEEKCNIDMFSVKDMGTGELYYFFKTYYASAPFNVNELYLLDAKWHKLTDYKTLAVKSGEQEINVTLSKKEGVYTLFVPEYRIEHILDSSYIYLETLESLVDNTDDFEMDAVLKIGGIDSFTSDGASLKTLRPLIDEKNAYGWLHFISIAISYEIRDGIITPAEYCLPD